MASVDKETHEREAQVVRGTVTIKSAECTFHYSRSPKDLRIVSAMHGEIDLTKVFVFSNDIFCDAEDEIKQMLHDEESEYDEEEQPSHGYSGSVVR